MVPVLCCVYCIANNELEVISVVVFASVSLQLQWEKVERWKDVISFCGFFFVSHFLRNFFFI